MMLSYPVGMHSKCFHSLTQFTPGVNVDKSQSLLSSDQIRLIGRTLLEIPHIRRIRFASKGLCVSPVRTLDPNDDWTDALIEMVKLGRMRGKHVALHTHFNHANEFTWVTREAMQRLTREGVTVRNQSVLLKGVNDTVESLGTLIRELADCGIIPVCTFSTNRCGRLIHLRKANATCSTTSTNTI